MKVQKRGKWCQIDVREIRFRMENSAYSDNRCAKNGAAHADSGHLPSAEAAAAVLVVEQGLAEGKGEVSTGIIGLCDFNGTMTRVVTGPGITRESKVILLSGLTQKQRGILRWIDLLMRVYLEKFEGLLRHLRGLTN